MRKIECLFAVLSILIACDAPSPDWQPVVSDALSQAIALEKLPDVKSVLIDSDTIWIYPSKHDHEARTFDEILAGDLPYHIDRWIVHPINSQSIEERSAHNEFSYLSISRVQKSNNCIIDIILETSFPPDSDLALIDRGRITITFEYKNKRWVVKSIIRWYG